MKNPLTYSQAFAALETLAEQLEEGGIQLEELAAKIKQANGLIEICETKLRKIDEQVEDAANAAITRKEK